MIVYENDNIIMENINGQDRIYGKNDINNVDLWYMLGSYSAKRDNCLRDLLNNRPEIEENIRIVKEKIDELNPE